MADKQILVTGSADAPAGYTVPNTAEIIPKSLSCVFDGTGASGDFVPVLEIISDGGVVVAQSPGSTVTAGGSVEQSWFRGIGGQSAAAATLDAGFMVRAANGQVIPSGADTLVSFTTGTYHAGSADLFGAANYKNNPLTFTANGVVIHQLHATFSGGYTGGEIRIETTFDQVDPATNVAYSYVNSSSGNFFLDIPGAVNHGSPDTNWSGNSPTQIFVYANQTSGSNKNLNLDMYTVMLPSTQQF